MLTVALDHIQILPEHPVSRQRQHQLHQYLFSVALTKSSLLKVLVQIVHQDHTQILKNVDVLYQDPLPLL